MIVSGDMTSDVTSDEYSSRIQELSDQVQTLRASIATALQERSEAEAQESLYGKRLDAEMSKSSTLKKDLRTSEMERIQLRDNLEQLEVVLQSESCSVPEHKLIKEELVELSNQHKQLEKQHTQHKPREFNPRQSNDEFPSSHPCHENEAVKQECKQWQADCYLR